MLRATVAGSAHVGVYTRALGDVVLVRRDLPDDQATAMGEALDATVTPTTVGGGTTIGSLATGNSNGIVISGQATRDERSTIANATNRPVEPIPGPMNAAGNLILANDNGAIVHPDLSDVAVDAVADTLDVPVERHSLATVSTVGMAGVANGRGVLCHPNATDAQLDRLSELLDVPADIGTINYGSPLVGSGLVANETGYVAGEDTTGPELGRIEDALGYV